MSFTKEQIAELKELIKECVNEMHPAQQKLSRVESQVERCKLQQRVFELEEEDADASAKLQEQLDNHVTVVDNLDFQKMLDCFDFEHCVESAEKLGYKYRGYPITIENLVEDSLELYDTLKHVENGSNQIGRLILNKFTMDGDAVYYMHFAIESLDSMY